MLPYWWLCENYATLAGVSGGHVKDLEWLILAPCYGYVIVRQWDMVRN